jgi:N-hydroxyarylamine O-acetyltransferase
VIFYIDYTRINLRNQLQFIAFDQKALLFTNSPAFAKIHKKRGAFMSFELDRYFDRIGWRPGNESHRDMLRLIHFHHITSIPFENLDVFNKKPVRVDPDSVYEKLVLKKRGGYCFEMNCLLYTALERMGFSVKPYSARISAGDMGYGPYTHRINIAEIDGVRYILDVGFGGSCFVYPLILEEGLEQNQLWMNYRVIRSETVDFTIQIMTDGVFTNMLGFNDKPALPMDFELEIFIRICIRLLFSGSTLCARSTPKTASIPCSTTI